MKNKSLNYLRNISKRLTLFVFVCSLIISTAVSVSANPYPNNTTNPTPVAVGIDVSVWNGRNGRKIDWQAVKDAGFSFVIIKISKRHPDTKISELVDERFEEYYEGAGKAGLKRGVYVFSYATSVEDAEYEAMSCLDTLKGRPLELPVTFDIESNDNIKKLIKKGKSTTASAINAFCNMVEDAGYESMVYTGAHFISKYIDYSAISDRRLWIARYPAMGSAPTYNDYFNFTASTDYPYYMWQFSSTAYVPTASYTSTSKGVTRHHCDVNFIYDPAFADPSGLDLLRYSTLQPDTGDDGYYVEDEIDDGVNNITNIDSNIAPTAMFFSQGYMTLDADNIAKYKLELSVFPANASKKGIKFESSDSEIAEVDAEGNLIPKKSGTVTIMAQSGFLTASTTIAITKNTITPTSIKLSDYELLMNVKDKIKLTATVAPENVTEPVSFSSSNTKVAKVSKDGSITAVGEGEAIISASVGSLLAECDVIVEKTSDSSSSGTDKKSSANGKKSEKKTEKKAADTSDKKTTDNADKTTSTEKSSTKTADKSSKPLDIVKSSVKMAAGEKYKFEVKLGEGISSSDISWQTSDPSVISGFDSGLMVANATGEAVLTARLKSDNTVKDTVKVKVMNPPTKISLNAESKTLKKGASFKIVAKLNSGAASAGITYKSSSSKVAKVSKSGNVRAVGKGTANITVTTHNNIKTVIKITVK